jgi:hypothetical protein
MANPRRTDKTLKKDQSTAREDRRDVEEQIRGGATKPGMRNPNRDQARGDWDRSRKSEV